MGGGGGVSSVGAWRGGVSSGVREVGELARAGGEGWGVCEGGDILLRASLVVGCGGASPKGGV